MCQPEIYWLMVYKATYNGFVRKHEVLLYTNISVIETPLSLLFHVHFSD